MNPLEQEINAIMEQYQLGNISLDEKNYLIAQIHDVRAELELIDDYNEVKRIKQICMQAIQFIR